MHRYPASLLLIVAYSAPGVLAAESQPVDFARDVAPIFVERCVSCHNPNQPGGGFDLTSAKAALKGGGGGPAIVLGKPGESWLVELISPSPKGERPEMPKKGAPLTKEQVATVSRWIAEGANWPANLTLREKSKADQSWWSLQPLRAVEPPSTESAPQEWQANPIDRFIYSKLAEKGLSPSPPADPRTLIRRATYDLTGLPPTSEAVEVFVTESRRVDAAAKHEAIVDQLLASPHYGEQWGRHWLDVVRFGESTGFERNVIIDNAWPFRDYVIRSFNDDKPFNRLILEHLAGDVIGKNQPEVEVATTFLVAGPYDNVGNQDAVQAAQIRANTIDDIVTATGTSFLGLTINCCRCHDHKFDPIPQEDYYRLQAAFAGVHHGSRPLTTQAEREEHATRLQPLEARRKELFEKKEALAKQTEDEDARKQFAQARRDLIELDAQIQAIKTAGEVWAGRFQQPSAVTYLMQGGDPAKRGGDVHPASLSALETSAGRYELPLDAAEAERRLKLAQWIASDSNPLTARVIANRIWQYHFGTGLVDTPNDFGMLGGQPTHPELLDWLARRLQHHGWRLKPLHREIMLSQTYRQSGAFRRQMARIDAAARYLWRFPPRRLAAEEVRDTVLAIAGKLDPHMGGPSFRLYKYVQDNVATYLPLDEHGPETYRRAVYHQNARASRVDLLSEFDCPDNAFSAPTRAATTTPLQALTLLNHRFTHDMAGHLAARVDRETDKSQPLAQVRRVFALAFNREPSDPEAVASVQLIERFGLAALCRAIINSNELIYLE
jgi:mono/diheme cytochrome c family protein